MSNDLRDLFKKELDQIPLRPAETWVPASRRRLRLRGFAWRTPLAIAAAVVVLIAAVIGGRQLATFRDRFAAAPGVVAGKAIYLSPSFNGSGWMQIDPETLKDVSSKPLLDIAPASTNSSATQVSEDGSTIIVSDFSSSGVTQRVFDGRTGQLRGYFVPEVPMVLDYLSADGQLGLGRLGDNRSPQTGEKVIVSIADGHVIRRVPGTGDVGAYQALPVAPDLSAIYFVTTPTDLSLISEVRQSLPFSLVVQSTLTGAVSAPIPLPGITAGTIDAGPVSALTALTVRPGISFSADGSRLAALSADGRTLDVVDTHTLSVTSVVVHRKTSLFDPLRPLVAEAKTLNDEEKVSMAFTPDGASVISWVTNTQYDDINGATRTTRGIQRIEVATGLIAAETVVIGGIYDFVMSPDGRNFYLVVRAKERPTPVYLLKRFDAQTLDLKAERGLPDYAEFEVLAAPSPAVAIPPPTLPTRTQPTTTTCTHDRLVYLVEQFFTLYNAHQSADLLTLFNIQVPAAGGGFADYYDNPGVPVHAINTRSLMAYWEKRFAAGDRFDSHTVTYPPDGATPATGNPTATFTRSFAGGTQQGNMQLDCNSGLLIAVRMSSDYAGWSWRDAFGARFSVPSSWNGPEDIDTQKDAGAPKNYLVFTDAAGKTQVTIWLWNATSTDEVATTRLAGGSRRSVTITDAGQSRDVIEVHAQASWYGPTGAGSYDNRHLLVQLTPAIVADVIVSAPQVNGPSNLSAEQIQLQDRITVRLSPIAALGPSPAREPSDLVRLPQEEAVLNAFADAGISPRTIGGSVIDSQLGPRLPARSFIVAPGQEGADVIFLDGSQKDIRVCGAASSPGRTVYSVSVNGLRTSGIDAGQPVFFAVSGTFFVEAYDVATYDALRRGLGLTTAHC